jgi:hypothetical protein
VTTAYEAGESLSLAMGVLAGGCPHQRAEPVILCTGEQVACICTRCYRQLPETWILDQRARTEREAYCQHDRRGGDRHPEPAVPRVHLRGLWTLACLACLHVARRGPLQLAGEVSLHPATSSEPPLPPDTGGSTCLEAPRVHH